MTVKTLKTLVLKTATVTGVKLVTPADRIGLGFGTVLASYPTDNLSPGLLPMPHNPEPEQVRSRQELSVMQMHKHLQAAESTVASLALPRVRARVRPTGSAGCIWFRVPGLTAGRFALCGSRSLFRTHVQELVLESGRSWQPQPTTRTVATSRTDRFSSLADPSRVHVPGDQRPHDRFGCDCQSPDRYADTRIAIRNVCSAAAAGK
jgi:hypothetical protein